MAPARKETMVSLTNPAPGGQIERTDQGVDWGSIRGNIGAVASGVIAKIYSNLQGFGYTIIERLKGSNQEVYYGLETGGTPIGVQAGEAVQAGQPLASGLGTGGIEVGYWNPATGRATGAPDFTGNNATPSGAAFRRRLNLGKSGPPNYLEQLWIEAGGPVSQAQTAAAVAMAESRGEVGAKSPKNTNGTYDYGLWQINSSHGFNVQRLLGDPSYNAEAAVSVWRSQGWSAWTTYRDGAYKSFLGQASTATVNYGGPGGGIVRPGGGSTGDSGQGIDQVFESYTSLRDVPRAAPPATKNPFKWWLSSFTGDWQQVKNSGVSP